MELCPDGNGVYAVPVKAIHKLKSELLREPLTERKEARAVLIPEPKKQTCKTQSCSVRFV